VNKWLLQVELNGEWEECRFTTRNEALSTFIALAEDYPSRLQRAILFAPALETLESHSLLRAPSRSRPN
jgi:hypothetical protein